MRMLAQVASSGGEKVYLCMLTLLDCALCFLLDYEETSVKDLDQVRKLNKQLAW